MLFQIHATKDFALVYEKVLNFNALRVIMEPSLKSIVVTKYSASKLSDGKVYASLLRAFCPGLELWVELQHKITSHDNFVI